LQTPEFIENPENRPELLSALEIVRIRLDPAHEPGLRFILQRNNNEAKPAALRLLARLLRDGAIPEVQKALNSENPELRKTAQELSATLIQGKEAIEKIVADLATKNQAETRRDAWLNLLRALGNQKETEVLIEIRKSGYKYSTEPDRQEQALQVINQAIQKLKSTTGNP